MKLGAAKTTKDASLPPQVGCRQRAKNSKTGGKHTAGYKYKVIVSLFGRTEPTLRILENIKTLLLQTLRHSFRDGPMPEDGVGGKLRRRAIIGLLGKLSHAHGTYMPAAVLLMRAKLFLCNHDQEGNKLELHPL